MTLPEFAQMVQYMRTHQKEHESHGTAGARIKAEHSERAVDKAVEQILADVPVDEADVAHVK